MTKLARFLKPFLGALAVAIVLLFVQAICDLNLPNLMSDIVNVGIQQGGVEDATPRAISKDGMTFVKSFTDDETTRLVDENFILVSGHDLDEKGNPWSETYPAAANAEIYVLDPDISSETLARLDEGFGVVTWTMVNVLKDVQQMNADGAFEIPDFGALSGTNGADATNNTNSTGAADDASSIDIDSLDLTEAYKMQPLLDLLPTDTFANARSAATAMDPSLRLQSGTMLTAGFYRELGVDMTSFELSYILRIGLIMLLVTVLSGIATILVSFISSRIGAGVARDLRGSLFEKVARFSHAEFDQFSTASLITRSTNDVTQIQMVLSLGIRMICYAPIMGIGGTIMALNKSVSMSWIIGVAVAVLLGIVLVLLVIVMPKFQLMQKLIDRVNLVARETLGGLMVIRAFSRSDFEAQRFEDANRELTATNLFVNRAMTFMMPVLMLFMNGLTVLIIWVGAHQVAESQMQVGDMMAYMQYVMQIVMSFMFIAMMFIFIPRASVSAKRIAEVLSTEPSINDPAVAHPLDPEQKGIVEFRDVSFRYAGANQNALCNISFIARPGETTAFIGSTGSGKSTIINLIPRFYDATSGTVLVNGVDVREVTQSDLRSHIGYVPQQSVLMAGTLKSNIAYGTDGLSSADLEKVAEVAQALEFVDEKEERFGFEIAQGGTNVSGGQRQRISIARALAIDPDIYLFDDSFSALDFKTDAALRRALAAYTAKSSLIIVAQRVSTIMEADQIYVIDDGEIVGQGTHRELLKTCKAYLEIASSQLAPEELEGGVA